MRSIALPLTLLLAGVACSHQDEGTEQSFEMGQDASIAKTTWQLAEIADHPLHPALIGEVEADLYTLALDPDGRVAFGLDCNRGSGRWQGAILSGETSGELSFSQVGVTKALCGPESISVAVTADLARVERFALDRGRLVLSDAEGAVRYLWEPGERAPDRGGE